MGAFLLISAEAKEFDVVRAIETIRLQSMTEPLRYKLPGWDLYLFPKGLISSGNYLQSGNFSVFITGTAFTPYKNFTTTLSSKLEQLKQGALVSDDIHGLYFLLLNDGSGLRFMTDSNGLYSIYHTYDGRVISSSFLGLCGGWAKLSPDRDAIVENLLTGSLIGADTVFSEIKRFEPKTPFSFRGLGFIENKTGHPATAGYKSRKESLSAHAEILDSWFSGIKPLAEEFGVDSGITGGLDSRLLFALCRRHFSSGKIQFHSHLRKTIDKDFLCGKEICEKTGMEFIKTPVSDISDVTDAEIENLMNRGMMFNDGQVRTHSFWHEEFNSREYRVKTLMNKRLGLNGIGGEQYRNMERFLFPSRDLYQWIRFELVDKYSGSISADARTMKNLTERIYDKIGTRLEINGRRKINLLIMKRYVNEIYNPGNRVLRASHENRFSFFLSPFADPFIARSAYSLTEHLGLSMSYEAELINLIDPEVASFNSSYGFRFNRGEPLASVVPGVIFGNFLPRAFQKTVYELQSKRITGRWEKLRQEFGYLSRCVAALDSLCLPVNVGEIVKRTDLGPLIFAIGHLFITYNEKMNR